MNDRMKLKVRRALVLGQETEIPNDVLQYLEGFWKLYTNITGPNGNTPSDETVALALWMREKELEAGSEDEDDDDEELIATNDNRTWSGRGRKPNWLKEQEQKAGV